MLGLYCHIPFCAAICNYCNFNRGLLDEAQKRRYVDALVVEIARAGLESGGGAADTIFLGGGTPSLLTADEVGRILEACRRGFAVAEDCEITLEANPETVTPATLGAYKDVGVNRVSFGVQSFRDGELTRLSRLHGADRARLAYRQAREAGFGNISLDLMMWLPGQSVAEWLESVEAAIELDPEHLSLYMLEVYPNAPLRDEMARRQWSQAPDDDVSAMYLTAMSRLEASGFEQYEISNVAKPGRRARHNLKYWTDGDWYGFGCGAHSTVGGVRWKNVAGTDDYIARVTQGEPATVDRQILDIEQRLGDALFTGLRLTDGVDVLQVNARYRTDVWQRYGSELQRFVDLGLLEADDRRWRLTRDGFLLAHEVMQVFV
jgi:oxygen-independent coproporphyrinogen-3 oxidase